MNEVELILPYAPSVNHYKSIGRTITTKRGKKLQLRVNSVKTTKFFWEVKAEIMRVNPPRFLDEAIKLEVWVELYPPSGRRYDADNRLKVLLDALQHGGLYADDSQITLLHVEKKTIIANGRCIVRVKPYV